MQSSLIATIRCLVATVLALLGVATAQQVLQSRSVPEMMGSLYILEVHDAADKRVAVIVPSRHVSPSPSAGLSSALERYISLCCHRVLFEANIWNPSVRNQYQSEIARIEAERQGKKELSNLLEIELRSWLAPLGIDEQRATSASKLPPLALSQVITTLCTVRKPGKSASSVEQIVLESAHAAGLVQFDGLEYPREVYGWILSVSNAEWMVHIRAMLNSVTKPDCTDGAVRTEQEVNKRFAQGDFEGLFWIQHDYHHRLLGSGLVFDRLVSLERNLGIVNSIKRQLQNPDHPAFVIGAAHFGGPHNIMKLLEAQGYRLKAVKIGE
jgi:uncharacterized protein YbaP (TraB family)